MTIEDISEANIGTRECCLFCKFFDVSKGVSGTVCTRGEEVTNPGCQVCGEWRSVL